MKKNTNSQKPDNTLNINIKLNKYVIYAFIIFILLAITVLLIFFFKSMDKETITYDPGARSTMEIEKPKIQYKDGQTISLQDLNITWGRCENAWSYKYNIYIADEKQVLENEPASTYMIADGSFDTHDPMIIVPTDKLGKDKWVRISIAACAGEAESWSTTYLYIDSNDIGINTNINIKKSDTNTVLDGVISENEYGEKIHSIDYENNEFNSAFDPDKCVEADFYMTWDNEFLNIAWVVYSENHWPVPDMNNDGVINEDDLMYMWQYTNVQFMLSTGEPNSGTPKYQIFEWDGDYLEAGLSVMPDGKSENILWSSFLDQSITRSDIQFSGKRDEAARTTIYEVKIPWERLGKSEVNAGDKIGFSYAVSVQQNYYGDPHMIEWQNSILGTKNMDTAAVITLS